MCEHKCSVRSQVAAQRDDEHQNELVLVQSFPFSTVTTTILQVPLTSSWSIHPNYSQGLVQTNPRALKSQP